RSRIRSRSSIAMPSGCGSWLRSDRRRTETSQGCWRPWHGSIPPPADEGYRSRRGIDRHTGDGPAHTRRAPFSLHRGPSADLLKLIRGLVTPGTWYFDVGANIGLMSVPVLQSVHDCHVLSLEPSPNSYPFLERTWLESPWKDRWVVKIKAAGAQSGQVEFCLS